jgi:type I restriction enzyme M protein
MNIAAGDTLRDPKNLTPSNTLRRFDRVLANPPFSLKEWGHGEWKNGDKFGRDRFGCPPKSYGDYAFVQHMLASLGGDGVMGVVLPHGVLFRGGAEGRIREGLLREDLVEAVVGLGPNLFYGSGIPACILVMNRSKPAARKGKVLFIHGAEELVEGKAQNHLSEENVARMAGAFHAWEDVERFCRVIGIDEIEMNDFNLNIPRYVNTTEPEASIDMEEELATLKLLLAERNQAEEKMLGYLKELGYGL